MYSDYWQLNSAPFENNVDTRFYFESESHHASLLKLRYMIENDKGAGLIVGGTGLGKTFVLNVLAESLEGAFGPFVHLVFPQMTPGELLAYLAAELGAREETLRRDTSGLDRTIRTIQQQIQQYNTQGRHPVLLVDEAHMIEDQTTFQALRLLMNFQPIGLKFSLIFSGQTELLSRIRRIPQLEERLGVKCILRPMPYEETLGYIAHRIRMAGVSRALFTPDALESIFELSGGIPRQVNRLCDLALLVGLADNSEQVTADQVEAVSEELTALIVE